MVKRIQNKIKKTLAQFLSKYSHYHFITRQWEAVSDIEVLEKAMATAYFHNQLQPIQPKLDAYRKVLLLAPHQDDESIGCGGLLHLLKKHDTQLSILYTTTGAQANLGMSIEETIALRNQEAKQALAMVGAEFQQLDIDNISPIISEHHLEVMIKKINDFQPDLILLPWLFDLPIKHRLTNHMLALITDRLHNKDIAAWGYQVHNHLLANIAIDISKVIDQKRIMIDCFKSQNENFKNYTHQTIGLNAFNSKYCKGSHFAEIFFGLPLKEYSQLVLKWYGEYPLSIYKGHQAFVDNMLQLQKNTSKR